MAEKEYILGVDDDPINRIVMKEILGYHYEIQCVEDGETCLQQINERIPDVILLDVNMPGMNGLEVCKKIRSNSKTAKVPIIYVSALATSEERIKGYEAGGNEYVIKPFVEEELLQKIKFQIAQHNDK